MAQTQIRLRAIRFDVDFRCSEWTNYETFRRSKKFPGELRPHEAFLFVSKKGDQLVWIMNVGEYEFENGRLLTRNIIDSRRWRITSGGTWNPMMLADYAEEVGIDLVGIKKFADLYIESRSQ